MLFPAPPFAVGIVGCAAFTVVPARLRAKGSLPVDAQRGLARPAHLRSPRVGARVLVQRDARLARPPDAPATIQPAACRTETAILSLSHTAGVTAQALALHDAAAAPPRGCEGFH